MKVKVGDTVYDGRQVPIMVILTEEDKKNIASMTPQQSRYIEFPDGTEESDVRRWILDD